MQEIAGACKRVVKMNKRELDWIFFYLFEDENLFSLNHLSSAFLRDQEKRRLKKHKQGKGNEKETKPAIRSFLSPLSLSLHLNARVLYYNTHKQVSRKQKIMAFVAGGISTLRISAANHVRPKGAKESRKNRPVKHRPSDKNRAPTNYPTVDPAAVPPVYTIVSEAPKKTD